MGSHDTRVPYRQSDRPTSVRVDDLLDRMSTAEKAGQLVGTWCGQLRHENDIEDAKAAIRDHHIGVAAPFGWAGALCAGIEETVETVNDLQRFALEETALGIPLLLNVDAVHGNAYVAGATVFPNALGTAATWDTTATETVASVTATEVRRMGAHQNYSPTCDVGRDPRWGRIFETFGESPRLCAELVAAKVRGYQGDGIDHEDSVVATAKHFPAYSEPERGEDASPVDISEYKLRNTFLPSFEAALDAGVASVMPSYNSINGEPVHGSETYLTDLLHDDLGFEGHVVSDWNGVRHLSDDHRTASDQRDGVRHAHTAGLDVASVGHVEHAEHLVDLVESGEIDEGRLDESVRRVLRVKFEMGLFEDPFVDADAAHETLGNSDHRQIARETARDSMTLLKNDGLLPLDGDEDVFVGGPNADDIVHQLGGWSVPQSAGVPGDTVLDAIDARSKGSVTYEQGTTLNEERDIDAAVEKATAADVAVIALGEGWYLHEFGPSVQAGVETGAWPTRSDLHLSDAQRELVRRVHDTGTPVVGVLVTGRPLIVDWMAQNVSSILMAYYPGTEGGTAIAETLFGDNDPSGRLPISIPRSMGDLPQYHDCLAHPTPIGDDEHPNSYDPLYPFGHGLSYTEFAFDDLRIRSDDVDPAKDVDVTVTVSNTGNRHGTETVQVFATQETSSRVRPRRFLVGFDRVGLNAGESANVDLSIPAANFGYYEPGEGHVLETGTYHVTVDDLVSSFEVASDGA
ncbi:glycoside hydrolase family 3 N-terminal domain-containing protein [Halococcus saccharolyticus]|uniref:beta-glucosidase n=1 Tax=Halococcus saccharolyticus DSM 5350 TaxID=1227455 RepID=M0MP25_9EURY|nr:glycoside hydrolase family 3 N-terminal domain-containing protein [Halococcus saccharolyticus]EMA47406.1 Beta-glucosidase [Halococcus saccharolyticus DSM 5350]